MPKPSPSLYSIPKTFMWFTIVSLVLTGSLVGIVWMDYAREWKGYQKKFTELKLRKVREELAEAGKKADPKILEDLRARLKEAEKDFASRAKDRERLQKEIGELDSKIVKIKMGYQTKKQFEDSYRYYLEEYRLHHDAAQAAEYEKKLNALSPEVQRDKGAQESLEKQKEAKEAELAGHFQKKKELQKEIDKALEEKNRLEKLEGRLKPSLVTDILNAPMLDFIAPSIRVQQIVLEDLQEDYHFAKVQKVDRCVTCHLGIDQKGFEDAPQPFRTHPNLDLYLGSASAHPMEKIGCTVCHGGSGQALGFIETAHTPNNEAQEKEWKKKHRWRELEGWENKMLPLKHTEAACAKCHTGTMEVPKAEKLNKGRNLAKEMGCFNCHKIDNFPTEQGEPYWKVGPDLKHVDSKLEKDWMIKWLEDPTQFRPSTKMPKVFHLSNTSTPEDTAKNNAAIHGIVEYLLKNSEPVQLIKPAAQGNAADGEKWVKELGCLGCHSLPAGQANAAGMESHHGPELSNLGSKVTPEWLYTWLKDPKHYSADTRMPNLRLSDQEAADITAHLLIGRNEAFEAKAPATMDPGAVDELLMESMQGAMRRSEAQAELQKMTPDDKLQLLGKKSITHQGCFGCHNIRGFEDAKPIGAELSDEGRKNINTFDFGFVHIEKTRQDWVHQKIKEPRIFDAGKIKAYYEKLRMPQFNFSEEELESLTTFVLSLSEEQIPLAMQRTPDRIEQQIEKGRFLVTKLNCNGCHTLDGKEGILRKITEDPGAAPPVIDGEGAKVREKWLHEFLKSPSIIRPWLKYRMPTFDFSDEELNALVLYFHHLAHQEMNFGSPEVPPTTGDLLEGGKTLFDAFQCVKCHQVTQDSAAMGSSFLAPDLTLSKHRLKPEWVLEWIKDPQMLQEGTMMPTYFPDMQSPMPEMLEGDAAKQIRAIRDYLYHYEPSSEKSGKKE